MRKQFCDAMVARAGNPKMVFLTGDLGFMALEPLREALGDRFINAGVSEQNMISVAAALAHEGFEVWAYSIAPFCYARPFEQIRNDITFHNLPVKLIGNGGGYGYGVMGPTHHAIEDYGVLLTLPNMTVIVPVFDEDVGAAVEQVAASDSACYLRLGRGEAPTGYPCPTYSAWRQLIAGDELPIVVVGPLAGSYLAALSALDKHRRPNLWVAAELPVDHAALPQALLEQIAQGRGLCVVEEHVRHGGFAAMLLQALAARNLPIQGFRHLCATSHHFERYGSQKYLRQESGLSVDALLKILADQ